MPKEHHGRDAKSASAGAARAAKTSAKNKDAFQAWAKRDIDPKTHSGKIQIDDVRGMKGFESSWGQNDATLKRWLKICPVLSSSAEQKRNSRTVSKYYLLTRAGIFTAAAQVQSSVIPALAGFLGQRECDDCTKQWHADHHPAQRSERQDGPSRSSLYDRVKAGTFPAPIRLGAGAKATGWIEAEVNAWIEEQISRSRVAA
ncbi:hypothetical protein MASR1M42_10470 [Azonexus hydrophilus]